MAVYGLYGAATNKWDIHIKIEAGGAFDAFWETIAFMVNGIIFFYSGVACINFIVRSAGSLLLHDAQHKFKNKTQMSIYQYLSMRVAVAAPVTMEGSIALLLAAPSAQLGCACVCLSGQHMLCHSHCAACHVC